MCKIVHIHLDPSSCCQSTTPLLGHKANHSALNGPLSPKILTKFKEKLVSATWNGFAPKQFQKRQPEDLRILVDGTSQIAEWPALNILPTIYFFFQT